MHTRRTLFATVTTANTRYYAEKCQTITKQ